jgi:alpha-tubulin suppressor-like RCC1 family protein
MPVNYFHNLVLTETGQVYSCGYNSSGQIGIGDETPRTALTEVHVPMKFISIAAGFQNHSVGVAQG